MAAHRGELWFSRTTLVLIDVVGVMLSVLSADFIEQNPLARIGILIAMVSLGLGVPAYILLSYFKERKNRYLIKNN